MSEEKHSVSPTAPQLSMTPQQQALSEASGLSAFSKYRELVCASGSLGHFIYFEVVTSLLATLGGLGGMLLRSVAYPPLFKKIEGKLAIARGVTIRNPANISFGRGVLVDDWSVLDARGTDASLTLGHGVSVGRFTSLVAKHATINLENAVNIGSYCRIATQSKISIGESTLIGAYCYIGPGNHQEGDEQVPLIARPMDIKGGVSIGRHSWLGARVTVLDGVTIGEGAIVGAHSLVKEDVPPFTVVAGVPAKVVRKVAR